MEKVETNKYELDKMKDAADKNTVAIARYNSDIASTKKTIKISAIWAVVILGVAATVILGGWAHQSDNGVKVEQIHANTQLKLAGK